MSYLRCMHRLHELFPCFATCGGKVLKGEEFEREASERNDRADADLQV